MDSEHIGFVQDIEASYNSSIIAGGRGVFSITPQFESTIYIWDIIKRRQLAEFKSCLQLGGDRLAISEDGKLCAVGAYHRFGILMHNTSDGSVLWQRKDLKGVQGLNFDPSGKMLIAEVDRRSAMALDAHTGELITKYRGADWFIVSPYQNIVGAHYRDKFFGLINPKTKRRFATLSFHAGDQVTLNAVFSADSIFVSEMRGPVNAFSLNDGRLLWSFYYPRKGHYVRLGYTEQTNTLWGLLWDSNTSNQRLCSFNVKTGEMTCDFEGQVYDGCFALKGKLFVTDKGSVYDLTKSVSPELIAHLAFPK